MRKGQKESGSLKRILVESSVYQDWMNPLWVSFLLLAPNTFPLLEQKPEGQVERRPEPGGGKIRKDPRNRVWDFVLHSEVGSYRGVIGPDLQF